MNERKVMNDRSAITTRIDTPHGPVEIRELDRIEEMIAAEALQVQVWGAEVTPHPKEILIPVQHEGGLLAGAFSPQNELIGLIFGFPTRDPATMHSQMLATLESWRGLGIGVQMKWFQRAWCLKHGYEHTRWTVDPLRVANAELNIRHLGGTASTYLPDYYGRMQGIDAGAPTDRLLVAWDLRSPRVAALAEQTPADQSFVDAEPALQIENQRPSQAEFGLTCPRIRLRLPEDFIRLAQQNPAAAVDWRLQTRALLQYYFAAGYAITGFTRMGGPAYLLERRSSTHAN